jgi:hypothetical protein
MSMAYGQPAARNPHREMVESSIAATTSGLKKMTNSTAVQLRF